RAMIDFAGGGIARREPPPTGSERQPSHHPVGPRGQPVAEEVLAGSRREGEIARVLLEGERPLPAEQHLPLQARADADPDVPLLISAVGQEDVAVPPQLLETEERLEPERARLPAALKGLRLMVERDHDLGCGRQPEDEGNNGGERRGRREAKSAGARGATART